MIELSWHPEWDTGIEIIDSQHRDLFERVERLFNAMHNREDTKVEELLEFLGTYVVEHFRTEEDLMKKVNYPGFSRHLLTHQSMKVQLSQIKPENLEESIIVFLIDWLVEHINHEDRQLAVWLHNHKI